MRSAKRDSHPSQIFSGENALAPVLSVVDFLNPAIMFSQCHNLQHPGSCTGGTKNASLVVTLVLYSILRAVDISREPAGCTIGECIYVWWLSKTLGLFWTSIACKKKTDSIKL